MREVRWRGLIAFRQFIQRLQARILFCRDFGKQAVKKGGKDISSCFQAH
jgi:hypothetical protein